MSGMVTRKIKIVDDSLRVANKTTVGRWMSPDKMTKMQKLERYKKAIRVRRTLLIQQMKKHLLSRLKLEIIMLSLMCQHLR